MYQHLTAGRGGAVNVQPWQLVNLVGAPLAAILLLPPILDDLERWWRGRAEEPAEADRRRPGGS